MDKFSYFLHYYGFVYNQQLDFVARETGTSRAIVTCLWTALLEYMVADDECYAPTINGFDFDRFCYEFDTTLDVVEKIVEKFRAIGWMVGDCIQYEGYWEV